MLSTFVAQVRVQNDFCIAKAKEFAYQHCQKDFSQTLFLFCKVANFDSDFGSGGRGAGLLFGFVGLGGDGTPIGFPYCSKISLWHPVLFEMSEAIFSAVVLSPFGKPACAIIRPLFHQAAS